MPKKVISSESHVRQTVMIVAVAVQLVSALIVTIVPAINSLLWVPSLLCGGVMAAVFVAVHKHKYGLYIWRGVGALLTAVVLGALGLFVYTFFWRGAFGDAALDWLQLTVVYAYTVLLCTLTAPLTAALYRARFDVWVLRIASPLALLLALYIHVFDYYFVGTVLHPNGTEWLNYVLMAAAAVGAVTAWLLPMQEKEPKE